MTAHVCWVPSQLTRGAPSNLVKIREFSPKEVTLNEMRNNHRRKFGGIPSPLRKFEGIPSPLQPPLQYLLQGALSESLTCNFWNSRAPPTGPWDSVTNSNKHHLNSIEPQSKHLAMHTDVIPQKFKEFCGDLCGVRPAALDMTVLDLPVNIWAQSV